MRRLRGRGDEGQVAVEFAGMIPLILLTLALLWQVVLVGYAYTLAGNAADEAARVCAVDGDYRAAGTRHLDGAWSGSVDCPPPADGMVTVTVSIETPILFPGLGGFPGVQAKAGAVYEGEDR
ncbi:pilus assembly protein [Streptomyces sp. R302]|uniref:TadE/TadG family type IV pilus assembly protein n=1 Tax=unclassified Streptomyces TaxID=2593676 RepID=UPI00145D3F0C|nr:MULTISPECIES: TadE/TadG family type IV pilus assembly protein [unclassified Streptomyces]NML52941.1 pilus assembly protein [Streptomyces sp. R301]NML78776.1 pilus assembly protein [Streptomyces sp. R302]